MNIGLRKILPLSILLAFAMTGCAGRSAESAAEAGWTAESGAQGTERNAEWEAENGAAETERAAEGDMEENAAAYQNRNGEKETYQWADTAAQGIQGIHEPPSGVQPVYSDGTPYESQKKQPTEEQLKAAVDALQHYFGITLNLEEYETSIHFRPEETFEGELYKGHNTIRFNALANRDKYKYNNNAYVTPDYSVSFLENGEIKDIYLHGMYTVWEEAPKPPTVEEAKKLTREFLLTTKLFDEKNIELLGAGYANDTSIAAVYKDGKDGAIVVAVDVPSGKIDCFDRMSVNRAMKWITPIEAGSGKG